MSVTMGITWLVVCSFATLMVYKIPMEDIKSLAKSFSELEKGELNIPEPVCL